MKDFETVYRLYFRDVYLYAFALTKDIPLAEDITAETFAKALAKIHTFKGECDLRVWLCQIAKNQYLSHCRKSKKLVPLPEEPIPSEAQFEEIVEDQDLAQRIDRFVREMPGPYREVFILRTYYELSYKEIARSLGHTESWARVTYTRAKRIIQNWIREEHYG